MKILPVCFWVWLPLLLFTPAGRCQHRVHCRWGGFGEWSACDPCTNRQSRSRPMVVYAQFGGNPCGGSPGETRACETTQHCPLGRMAVETASDAHQLSNCGATAAKHSGPGFDAVTGTVRGVVINTQLFGGQCRPVQGLTSNSVYRIPLSTLSYKYAVKVEKHFSEEVYSSKWEYAKKDISRKTVTGTTTGFSNYDFHDDQTRETRRLLVLKNNIEVATFQNDAPQYVPISEPFWKALSGLPVVYDYTAYRGLVERFGTHYRSEGTLGGSFTTLMYSTRKSDTADAGSENVYNECEKPIEFVLFIPLNRETCSRDSGSSQQKTHTTDNQPIIVKTDVKGGLHHGGLYNLDMSNAPRNWKAYTDWADSLTSVPEVTEQKLRPLSELVKEVPCAGVKKLYLRRAIEQYVAETHPCHCQPCRDNGVAVRRGLECKCICKPGVACEQGIGVSVDILCSGSKAPKDVYLVGDTIEYSCITEHHLMGHSTIQCLEDQTWSQRPGSCRASKCLPPDLTDGVLASTQKALYSIGEIVTLSCPPGKQLLGETEIICGPNLHFSPSPESVHCSQGTVVRATLPPIVQCPPGEKSSRGRCICMFPFECRPSLEVCAVLLQRAPALLSVCRLHALRCLGKGHTLVENSACQWPGSGTAAACDSCRIWEVCDDQTQACRCKEASDCADPAESRVCVREGEEGNAPNATMGECEAGRRRKWVGLE
ncbi:hypothetical protein CRUP_038674 [Coryphaenoides rupestris]|nr:hypothetical protein CRUP_038674 [Coryphaenoides rupestris]